jgi:carbon-monoxide dehydrogenase medium subunit
MKPAPFAYYRPESVDEVLDRLAEHGDDAKLLAGGQSLVPAMNFRLAQPAVLIDLNEVDELAFIKERRDGLHIGAMTRQRLVERSTEVRRSAPLLHETMPFIAHPQIRNRGTVGGSLAHADPAAELPAVSLVLEARIKVKNQRAERWVPASEFYTGLFGTALAPEDLVLEVHIPSASPRTGWAFDEVSRRHGDYALVGVAASVTLDGKGRCKRAAVGLLSVGAGPVLAQECGNLLEGEKPTADAIAAAADAAATKDIDPPGDIHASTEYRRHLARVLTRRVLSRAAERAGEHQ